MQRFRNSPAEQSNERQSRLAQPRFVIDPRVSAAAAAHFGTAPGRSRVAAAAAAHGVVFRLRAREPGWRAERARGVRKLMLPKNPALLIRSAGHGPSSRSCLIERALLLAAYAGARCVVGDRAGRVRCQVIQGVTREKGYPNPYLRNSRRLPSRLTPQQKYVMIVLSASPLHNFSGVGGAGVL